MSRNPLRDHSVQVSAAALVCALAAVVVLTVTDSGTTAGGQAGGENGAPTEAAGPLVGRRLPPLNAVSLDGRPMAGTSRDGPTVVVVWTPDCDCTDMFRVANDLYTDSSGGEGAPVVGVALGSDIASAAETALESSLLFPSAIDTGSALSDSLSGDLAAGILVVGPGRTIEAVLPRDTTVGAVERAVEDAR